MVAIRLRVWYYVGMLGKRRTYVLGTLTLVVTLLAQKLALAEVAFSTAGLGVPSPGAPSIEPQPKETRVYSSSIPDEATFHQYSRVVGTDRLGKFLIDLKTGQILFFDVNIYRMHVDFVYQVLYKRPFREEDREEYNLNYLKADKPRFILGYLTHHLKTNDMTFSFGAVDQIRPAEIRNVYHRLLRTFYDKGIKFRPDSPRQELLLSELQDLPSITNDKIYKAADFQAFNKGSAIGILRIVPKGTPYESLTFRREEIVILEDAYPDITPVAGIISSHFSTPLSHVNLRATAWNIPNAGQKQAAQTYAHLNGTFVFLEVTDMSMVLRQATPKEIQSWKDEQNRSKLMKVPSANLKVKDLRSLEEISYWDTKSYGTKTTNLGVIVSADIPGVNVPAGFGIPFFYYQSHMKKNRLDRVLERTLRDYRFKTDPVWRKNALEKLRTRITEAPIDPHLLSMVSEKVKNELSGKGVFVRSSTNAEDLEGFNGAGLYETVPNVRGEEALAKAIKTVWASLWNFHAVEERTFFGIDHRACYSGVLIQVGINATAAGVLITKNIYDPEYPQSFTINAKHGLGIRVVGGKDVPEQIVYNPLIQETKIISRSDDPVMLVFDEQGGVREIPNPNKTVILTEARAGALAKAVQKIRFLFPFNQALDIEWVFEGEKVWIVQSRPYISKN